MLGLGSTESTCNWREPSLEAAKNRTRQDALNLGWRANRPPPAPTAGRSSSNAWRWAGDSVTRTRATDHVQDWGAELTAYLAWASVGIRQYVRAVSWCVAPSGRVGGSRSASVVARSSCRHRNPLRYKADLYSAAAVSFSMSWIRERSFHCPRRSPCEGSSSSAYSRLRSQQSRPQRTDKPPIHG